MRERRRTALLVVLGVLVAAVVGCGGEEERRPPATVAVGPVPGTPVAMVDGRPTVGELADRIAAAWAGVRSYRARFVAGGRGSPAAGPAVEVVDEVAVPDRKRRTSLANGAVVAETVAVGGRVWARGETPLAAATASPAAGEWVLVDPAAIDLQSQIGFLYADLIAPARPLYTGLSEDERGRRATPLGEVTVGGRSCAAYRIADTTPTGERIEVVLALGPDDLPCSLETRVGGTVNVTTWAFNVPVAIAAPGSEATPAAGTGG